MERENIVSLIGTVKEATEIKEINGMPFEGYKIIIETKRQSGVADEAIVLAEREAIKEEIGAEVNAIAVVGAIQTQKNKKTGKVLVYVLAESVYGIKGKGWEYENEVRVKGSLGNGTKSRTTPGGRVITDMFVKTDCIKVKTDCFIPCICWGKQAKRACKIKKGEEIAIKGRLQSRTYIKKLEEDKEEERTCYEVSIYDIESKGE